MTCATARLIPADAEEVEDSVAGARRIDPAAASHTPGPWSVGDPAKGENDLMVYCDDATGGRIADCINNLVFQHSPEEKRANARLIAAAPDLCALAIRVAEHFETTDSPIGQAARAALAKVSP